MSKNFPEMNETNQFLPNPRTFTGGDSGDNTRRAGAGIGAAFGQSPAMMSFGDNWQRKQGVGDPKFLNPADWFNGNIEGELTGDTSKDAKQSLARYGFFGAPWMPAMFAESAKKGDKIKENIAADAERQKYQQNFQNAGTPYNRYSSPVMNNQNQGGYYNDLVSQLFNNSQMGGLL